MKFHRKLLLTILTILFVVAFVWDMFLWSQPDKTTHWNYFFNAAEGTLYGSGCLISLFYGFKFGLKSNIGKMLIVIGIGQLGWTVGSFIWLHYNLSNNVAVPYPSWADAGYSIFYPAMVVSVAFLVKIYQPVANKKLVIGSLLVAVASCILIFGFIERPDLSPALPFKQKFFNVYYPAADIVSITLAFIALVIGRGKIHRSLYILALGLLLQVTGDLSFSYLTAKGTYWNGDIADLCFAAAPFVIGVSIVEIINSLSHQTNIKADKPAPTQTTA